MTEPEPFGIALVCLSANQLMLTHIRSTGLRTGSRGRASLDTKFYQTKVAVPGDVNSSVRLSLHTVLLKYDGAIGPTNTKRLSSFSADSNAACSRNQRGTKHLLVLVLILVVEDEVEDEDERLSNSRLLWPRRQTNRLDTKWQVINRRDSHDGA